MISCDTLSEECLPNQASSVVTLSQSHDIRLETIVDVPLLRFLTDFRLSTNAKFTSLTGDDHLVAVVKMRSRNRIKFSIEIQLCLLLNPRSKVESQHRRRLQIRLFRLAKLFSTMEMYQYENVHHCLETVGIFGYQECDMKCLFASSP